MEGEEVHETSNVPSQEDVDDGYDELIRLLKYEEEYFDPYK